MKVILASDLHGSAYYTERLLAIVESERPDVVAILGDVYYHGPRNPLPQEYDPKRVAAMLNGIKDKLVVVKGNCDSDVDAMISEFPIVESAVLLVGVHRVWLTHGHVYHPAAMPPIAAGDVLAYGHYHTVTCRRQDGVLLLNPGSISLPKDGRRAYAVIEDDTVTVIDLDGEVIAETRLD